MTLPIKICLIGSEPLYSKEYHLHKRGNGKIQMHFRQILQKNSYRYLLEKYRKENLYKKQKNKGELFSFLYKIN